jgi:hypothetical protein
LSALAKLVQLFAALTPVPPSIVIVAIMNLSKKSVKI